MEHLNEYLQQLVINKGESLHLEPNKNPYLTKSDGKSDVSKTPLQGAQINTMVFSLLPNDLKQQLPNKDEVQFTHPHALGSFDFSVQKSPVGFNVTISAADSETGEVPEISSNPPAAAPQTPEPSKAKPEIENFESAMEGVDIEVIDVENSNKEEPQEAAPKSSAMEATQAPTEELPMPPQREPVVETFEPQPSAPEPKPTAQEVAPPPPLSPPADQVVQEAPARPSPTPANPQARSKMDALFRKMADAGASDLHMSVSMPPMVRLDGKMAKLDESGAELTAESTKEMLTSIMPQKNIDEFAERNDTDFAYEIPGLARFRANIFMDRKGMGGVFRIIPSEILTAEDLNLSDHILELCALSKGLVVVTGPTGSGKSTTLCAMVDYINRDREDHIITIEDPIEFTHENKKCLVNQREVHNHTDSFKDALRAALREDPDILLVGEMRDLETISIAIETAETGHLVFGTLHTTTAASTIDRIIDQFPADRQQQIRVMLSESLRGVIAQTLLPKKGGGRIAALEVLIVTPAISNLIREGKTFQIPSAMQTGKNQGMVMLNDALMELCKKGIVEPRDAFIKAVDKDGFKMLLQRNGMKI